MNFQPELRKWPRNTCPSKTEMHFGPDQHGKWRVILFGRKSEGISRGKEKRNMSSPRAVSCATGPSPSWSAIQAVNHNLRLLRNEHHFTSRLSAPCHSFQRGLPLLHAEGSPYQMVLESRAFPVVVGLSVYRGLPAEQCTGSHVQTSTDWICFHSPDIKARYKITQYLSVNECVSERHIVSTMSRESNGEMHIRLWFLWL